MEFRRASDIDTAASMARYRDRQRRLAYMLELMPCGTDGYRADAIELAILAAEAHRAASPDLGAPLDRAGWAAECLADDTNEVRAGNLSGIAADDLAQYWRVLAELIEAAQLPAPIRASGRRESEAEWRDRLQIEESGTVDDDHGWYAELTADDLAALPVYR